jgi:glycosyltransferase involved in cell wall biosynthesis
VHLISSKGEHLSILRKNTSCPHFSVEISRNINFLKDIKSLVDLYFIFKLNKYDIVHSSTPKAGLLTAVSAFLARVPVRIHTFTGQRWATKKGLFKKLLMFIDKIICQLNTDLFADSQSQIDFLVKNKIVQKDKIKVIHYGSFGGVDFEKFNSNKELNNQEGVASNLKLNNNSLVLIFVGRINRDKGIVELILAFHSLSQKNYNVDLIIVGSMEDRLDPLPENIKALMKNDVRIHCTGYSAIPQKYLAIADIFCLPSYREGFGTSVIEAASMGLPAICTKIPGLIDAVVDGETGILIKKGSQNELESAIITFIDNPEMLCTMGEKAKSRAINCFQYEPIANKLIQEYRSLLK